MTSAVLTMEGSWRRTRALAAQIAAGIAVGAALPPLSFLPGLLGISVLSAGLLDAADFRSRFARALIFGISMALTSLHWIAVAFYAGAERFEALAAPAVIVLCVLVGVLFSLCLSIAPYRSMRSGLAAAIAMALLWLLGDLLRGEWGAQFPWNPIAVVWTVSDWTMQPIAWVGTYGLGVVTVAAFALIGVAFHRSEHRLTHLAISILLLGSIVVAGGWRSFTLAETVDSPVNLRIVQANIAQHHKGDPQARRNWFDDHVALSASASATPLDIIVWPESSVPYSLDHDPAAREIVAQASRGAVTIVGSDFVDFDQDPPVLHNSVYVLDDQAKIRNRYDKTNLVPFGEFLPFRDILGRLGLEALAVGSIDFSPGSGRRTIDLPGLPAFSPLICYEAIFAGAATDRTGRAAWLLNITNDGWFGMSAGPYQHLAMARMRAVETGLPLVRAANTGISVVTDGAGRVVAALPLGTTGVLDVPLPAPFPPPPLLRYPWLGLLLPIAAIGLALLLELIALRSKRREPQ